MGLNLSKGNMYEWIYATWNTIKGKCYHDCSYCSIKRYGKLNPIRFDEKELKTDLGSGRTIFVGSSNDMFADDIPYEWIIKTLDHCKKFDNTYLFQSKNPKGFDAISIHNIEKFKLCITIETNRIYPDIMRNAPDPIERAIVFGNIPVEEKYITIEPIMDFDLNSLVTLVKFCRVKQVNIGADSKGHKLPEPDPGKIRELIEALDEFTVVDIKKNLIRLL